MSYEMEAVVIKSGDVKKFDKFEICKFVVKTGDDKYPQYVELEAVGKAIEAAAGLCEHDRITCNFELRGREYNGRYYTSVRCWNIKVVAAAERAAVAADAQPDVPPEGLPF